MAERRRASARRGDAPPPSTGADEEVVLVGFLDHLRESIVPRTQGVPEPRVRAGGVPSGTSLLGLVEHLAHGERFSSRGRRSVTGARRCSRRRRRRSRPSSCGLRRRRQRGGQVHAGQGAGRGAPRRRRHDPVRRPGGDHHQPGRRPRTRHRDGVPGPRPVREPRRRPEPVPRRRAAPAPARRDRDGGALLGAAAPGPRQRRVRRRDGVLASDGCGPPVGTRLRTVSARGRCLSSRAGRADRDRGRPGRRLDRRGAARRDGELDQCIRSGGDWGRVLLPYLVRGPAGRRRCRPTERPPRRSRASPPPSASARGA